MDLNCDVGESFGRWELGDDAVLIPLVTSANVACGWHAGDAGVMRQTVLLCKEHGVALGAHPGYPDLQGFGRRHMVLAADEVTDIVLYQIGALAAFARAVNSELRHVKPHGALYNDAAADPMLAEAVVRGVRAWSLDLVMVGLAGSALTAAAVKLGQPVAQEGFIDRRYEADGSLRARSLPGAVLDHAAAVEQALHIAREGFAVAADGSMVEVKAETLCIHGDTAGAARLAAAVRQAFKEANIPVGALRRGRP